MSAQKHFNDAADASNLPKLDLVQFRRIRSIRPAPENNEVYNAIASDNPDLIELARSIQEHGVQDPLC
jgi:hypothetical protein